MRENLPPSCGVGGKFAPMLRETLPPSCRGVGGKFAPMRETLPPSSCGVGGKFAQLLGLRSTKSFFRHICCHQSRDIPTPGIAELPRDREKHIPGVVFGSSICWA